MQRQVAEGGHGKWVRRECEVCALRRARLIIYLHFYVMFLCSHNVIIFCHPNMLKYFGNNNCFCNNKDTTVLYEATYDDYGALCSTM